MKSLYCALAALVIVAGSANALDMKSATPLGHTGDGSSRVAYACDDGNLDNAYFQASAAAYGNAFDVGAGGPLSRVEFWHYGWFTVVGPYDYDLKVYDETTCTEIASIPLVAADAFDSDQFEEEDLCDFGVDVSGPIVVAVNALSCFDPTDCYPDVYFDQTGVFDGCDRIVTVADPTLDCSLPVLNGDFTVRINVDECGSTPTEEASWGQLKGLYR
jgi:hypothetical protein